MNKISTSYCDGAKISIENKYKCSYNVKFFNHTTNKLIYQSTIQNGMWSKANIKYYTKWRLEIWQSKEKIVEDILDLTNRKVHISISSKAMGDTIAWLPYIEQFRQKHNCELICSTYHNHLFESTYSNIEFLPPESRIDNLHASYSIGWHYKGDEYDKEHHLSDFKRQPLQKTAADILGLEFSEIAPKLKKTPASSIKEKYVTISTQSTLQAKYWNHAGGWEEVIKCLHNKGYKVAAVDKYKTFGASEFMNSSPECDYHFHKKPLDEVMSIISGAEFHIGLGSGLSWLAWALNTSVVLISSFSKPWCEFQTNCCRIYKETPTSGYFNTYKMSRSDWNWHPFQKIESMQDWNNIETISPNLVIEGVERVSNHKEALKRQTNFQNG